MTNVLSNPTDPLASRVHQQRQQERDEAIETYRAILNTDAAAVDLTALAAVQRILALSDQQVISHRSAIARAKLLQATIDASTARLKELTPVTAEAAEQAKKAKSAAAAAETAHVTAYRAEAYVQNQHSNAAEELRRLRKQYPGVL